MTAAERRTAQILVDASRWLGELPHNWTYIGYDEINYTYTPEGQELLGKFMALQGKPTYVRVHHLLCTGNCHGSYKWGSTNVYLEDELVFQQPDDDTVGWALNQATDPPTVMLLGSTCDQVRSEGVESVSIVYGCPTEEQPR